MAHLALSEMTTMLTFSGHENTVELVDTVKGLFAESYNIKVINVKGTTERFSAELTVNICDVTAVEPFLESYKIINNETLRVATTRSVLRHFFGCFVSYV